MSGSSTDSKASGKRPSLKLSDSLWQEAKSKPVEDSDDAPNITNTPGVMSPEPAQSDEGHTTNSLQQRRPEVAQSPNAKSKSISYAHGPDTGSALNVHPSQEVTSSSNPSLPTFRVGVSEDRNRKCRRTMEDAHSFIYDFGGVPGQGYFAVFDGHAGKHSAEWCGSHFHEYLLQNLRNPTSTPDPSSSGPTTSLPPSDSSSSPSLPIPDILNKTFLDVDNQLSALAEKENTHSGCTAVVAYLRVEGGGDEVDIQPVGAQGPEGPATGGELSAAELEEVDEEEGEDVAGSSEGGGKRARVKGFLSKIKGAASSGGSKQASDAATESAHAAESERAGPVVRQSGAKRTLYCANVGDARAVISRRGKAVRLTYDHKGSDHQEAKRITDAGGFVMNNRVNGVLAVTRALGDASVKEFVVGNPYTTETRLDDGDEFLIVACDGLWDVTSDQAAVDLIRKISDPQKASQVLLDHALNSFSTDNLSVVVVRLGPNIA